MFKCCGFKAGKKKENGFGLKWAIEGSDRRSRRKKNWNGENIAGVFGL